MSIYSKYIELKEKDSNSLYLFKVGSFYIFINEDAERISKITTLKIVNHAKGVIKCGFPKDSLEKYLDIFTNLNINVKVIEDVCSSYDKLDNFLDKIRKLDIDNTTPLDCFNIICELKKIL